MNELFQRARDFVYRSARPLDFARWRFSFEQGSREDVLRILSAYQNPDGGFGHGLEADCVNPDSAPIQTWCATTYLREVGMLDGAHPIVRGILSYLVSGAHFDGHRWAWSIPTNNDYPHAPWWNYPDADGQPNYNPTASLAGFLVRASEKDSPAKALGLRLAGEAAEFYLTAKPQPEQHLLRCYLELISDLAASCPDFPRLGELAAKVRQDVVLLVTRDAESWAGNYCCHPSDYFSDREDPLYEPLAAIAERECEFLAQTQNADGSWPITWNWGAYPDAFAVSAERWKSHIILNNLRFLQGMGKL